ncbi:MAG TPA: iron ABC transporter permease [Arachnia sp.]|nr:iron ABC transporter permease [Arachnia sp.]HMT84721.1 iron ABC transporter permease [Arachnia sp.]
MTASHTGRRVPARRPVGARIAPRQARGPAPVVLLLAVAAAAIIATPAAFLLVELSREPAGAARAAFLRPRTLRLLGSTVGLALCVIAGTLALGVPTGFLLARTDLRARRAWQVLAALPLAIPSYVAGFAWVTLTPLRGFWGAFVVLVLVSTPYVSLPVAAALRRADLVPEGVARTLGAGPLRGFLVATLPQVAPAAGAGALLVGLYTISDFGVVAIMRYPAFTWAIHTAFSGTFNRALAITLSLVLVALALLLVVAERSLRRRAVAYERVRYESESDRIRLSPGRQAAAAAGLGLVFLAAVGVPVATLLDRAVRSVANREIETARLLEATATTVLLGLAGAVLATALALPIAALSARHRTRLVAGVETATYLGHGLPGIVLGLSMVYLTLALVPALYQTLAVLAIAYGILFAPKSAGSARAAIAQVPPGLEDAARSLGRTGWGTWTAVTGRLAWPGVMTGALLVALTVMKELPATLMMRPTGIDTLATRLWQLTDIAAYGAAAPYAIALILTGSIPAFLLAQHSGRTP